MVGPSGDEQRFVTSARTEGLPCHDTTPSALKPFFQALTNKAIVDEQIASRRGLAPNQFQPDRRQPVEESSSAACDARSDHEPEFVDKAAGQQRLRDRD